MTNPEARDITFDEIGEFQVLNAVQMTVHPFAESLSSIIDTKELCTYTHSEHVAVMVQTIGPQIGLFAKQPDIFHVAGHSRRSA